MLFSCFQRFYERIAKTYRKEKWHRILSEILLASLDCARKAKNVDVVVVTSMELLNGTLLERESGGTGEVGITNVGRRDVDVMSHFIDCLRHCEVKPSKNPLVLNLTPTNCFLHRSIFQFQSPKGFVMTRTPFQLTLPPGPCSLPLRVSSIQLRFNHASFNHRFIDGF